MPEEWQPTNEPGRYDKARVARVKLVEQAIERLRLPVVRFRKLNGILNALIMQIEDGGDSPEVNGRLLDTLRASVCHQVGPERATAVLAAIDTFAQEEAKRWEQARAGTLLPPELPPEEELQELVKTGYDLLNSRQTAAACDQWLAAWELVKRLATPAMRTVEAFDNAYPGLWPPVSNWCMDLESELHNAGLHNLVYFEHRLRFARDFLAQFPDETADNQVIFRRAEGEALWLLGRPAEAEAIYQALVVAFPDNAWGYIGWSDEYYLWRDRPPNYRQAEAILRQALARPKLDDRPSVLERLAGLYKKWGKPQQAAAILGQLAKPKKQRPFRGGRKKRGKNQ
ncbi:MAG: hypothetical protein L0332_33725 [Chloroflexi bacterium]|nr:hypothetical protein [Chloroflexota bacterium]MCI0578768.1 hypothetical protein [Chloroflexota bacterium]MCI0648735.1 hypothetical protein [Chloroflexota bacterium]MCI0731663.1 hypothetical protein [Chloroflexota bacterium]